ncbi:DUF4870 domain-containing protein [Myroides sp. LJL115]
MKNQAHTALTADQGKTTAIISYLTLIGLIIAYFMNKNNPSKLASFHIRQSLGLNIVCFLAGFLGYVPVVGGILSPIIGIASLVAVIYCIIAAFKSEEKQLPIVGGMFQDWFSKI